MNLFGADTPVKVCPGCKGYGSCPECDPRLSPADDYLAERESAQSYFDRLAALRAERAEIMAPIEVMTPIVYTECTYCGPGHVCNTEHDGCCSQCCQVHGPCRVCILDDLAQDAEMGGRS